MEKSEERLGGIRADVEKASGTRTTTLGVPKEDKGGARPKVEQGFAPPQPSDQPSPPTAAPAPAPTGPGPFAGVKAPQSSTHSGLGAFGIAGGLGGGPMARMPSGQPATPIA